MGTLGLPAGPSRSVSGLNSDDGILGVWSASLCSILRGSPCSCALCCREPSGTARASGVRGGRQGDTQGTKEDEEPLKEAVVAFLRQRQAESCNPGGGSCNPGGGSLLRGCCLVGFDLTQAEPPGRVVKNKSKSFGSPE